MRPAGRFTSFFPLLVPQRSVSPFAWLGFGLLLVGLAGLLLSEARRSPRGIAIWKPVASLGFLVLGALGGPTLFLLALALSFVGDVGLIRMDRPAWFRVALWAFLLAHMAYVVAFAARGEAWPLVGVAALLLIVPGVLVARWIRPTREVVAYMIVISLMVALAVGTRDAWLVGAAILFYASDVTVARHRFVKAEPRNRLVGLPMYYAAQAMFAAYAAGLV